MSLLLALLFPVCHSPETQAPAGPKVHRSVRFPHTQGNFWVIDGLTKVGAEDLLDWLEAHGRVGASVSWEPGRGFLVRWPDPAGRSR